jgi:hypothetical protein
MKLIFTFFFATLLFCSCQKKEYTCSCLDASGRLSAKEITLNERTQNKAVTACSDKQTDLNVSGSNYRCTLKP